MLETLALDFCSIYLSIKLQMLRLERIGMFYFLTITLKPSSVIGLSIISNFLSLGSFHEDRMLAISSLRPLYPSCSSSKLVKLILASTW